MLESSVGVRELANEIYNFISSECILNKQPWKVSDSFDKIKSSNYSVS